MDEPPPASRSPRLLPALVAELRRRGVWRAASLYIVGAWAAIQVAGELASTFDLSRSIPRLVFILAVLGFPAVVLAAFLYRIGVGRESEVVAQEVGLTPRQLHWTLGGAMALGVGVLVLSGWFALRPPKAGMARSAVPTLVVQPFTVERPDLEEAYLGHSLRRTLVAHLETEGLRVLDGELVPGMNANQPLDSLARAHHIDFLLYGSLESSPPRLHVALSLVDPLSGEVLDRLDLERRDDTVLALVGNVMEEVSNELLPRIGRKVHLKRWQAGTRKPDAYELMLRARDREDRSESLERLDDAVGALAELAAADSLLARAVSLDRRYVDALIRRAWVGRSAALLHLVSMDGPAAEARLRQCEAHATGALEIDPGSAPAYEIRGAVRNLRASLVRAGDPELARRLEAEAWADIDAALDIDPTLVYALQVKAGMEAAAGDFARALVTYTRAFDLDAFHERLGGALANMFGLSFELASDSLAELYCAEIGRRASLGPGSRAALSPTSRAYCELQLAGWSSRRGTPSVAAAWRVAAAARAAGVEHARAGPQQHVLVAGVLARAGLADSARAVLGRARIAGAGDSELLELEAGVRVLLGDYDVAVELLREYARHGSNALLARSRRFASLPVNPLAPTLLD